MCDSTKTIEENGTDLSAHSREDEDTCREDDRKEMQIDNTNVAHFQDERPVNAMAGASWWSRIFFYWPYPLLKLGLERPLVETDIPAILPVDTSRYNREYLCEIWEREQERCFRLNNEHNNKINATNGDPQPSPKYERPSLHRAILKDFFRSIWYVQPVMFVAAVAKIVQAIYLGNLIECFDGGTENGYTYAGIIVMCGVFILFEHHHLFFITWRKGMQLRVSCVAAIYDKTLKLSSTHQETQASSGTIMNLASNDVERFLLAALFISHLIWSPLQSLAILVVGWVQLGPAFAVGFCLLIFGFVPFQYYLGHKFAFLRSKIASITDQRVQFVSQAVQGARVMKMSGYEDRFLDRISEGRKKEVAQITRANNLKALNEALFFASNIVVSLVIFFVHVTCFGGTLTPGNVYTVFTLVNILQLELTKHVALGVMGVSEVYVSISRIQKFLEYPEKPSSQSEEESTMMASDEGTGNDEIAVHLKNVYCYWNFVQEQQGATGRTSTVTKIPSISTTLSENPGQGSITNNAALAGNSFEPGMTLALSDISLELKAGQLTCVIGTVGSGKSALLQAIVGELSVFQGIISRRCKKNKKYSNFSETKDGAEAAKETISYASQDPWIMDGTVRENVTMGHPFDLDWYDRVIDACGLRLDFEVFRHGDQTIVGDRGVQCSGGQRARIGLARAIYRDADVLVADDPLSAVDARVGKHIFHEALLGLGVKRGKCVVLATHQHQYVHDYECVLLVGGCLQYVGSYSECVDAAGGKLSLHEAADGTSPSDVEGVVRSKAAPAQSTDQETRVDANGNHDKSDKIEKPKKKNTGDASKEKDDSKEEINSGVVKWETYKNYIRAMGGWGTASFLLLTFCVTQGVALWTIVTMGKWSELSPKEQGSWNILGLIIGQVFMAIILSTFRSFLSFAMTIKASKNLHDEMAKAILRAKIAFFDTNPMGRILNRFSADVGSNDDLLPQTLFDFFVIFFIVIGAVFTTVITLPFVFLVMPPLIYYFVVVRSIFVTSTRELKRLESVARSPIFAMMNESLSGIATIRANDTKKYFTKKFEGVHDAHTRAFFSFIASSRWFGFRMDALAFLLMSSVCLLSVLFQTQGWFEVDPAILGLSISMLIGLCNAFQWCIRQSAEIVNQMVCVERVLGYGKIEPEAPLALESDKDLDSSWPYKGAIDVKDVAVRYRPSLPFALDGASFSVPSGARVGVVGRTGSGKSTIVQTLFRLLEAECGQINIDDVNISEVGLHRLRTSISVIPQHPTLFSGCTVRENLDVFGLHSEEAIHEALKSAHMNEVISELPKGINSIVSEGGSNFSVGQRQLLCLARAILSKNKILILDEATASVDRRTDQMLQESLHDSFGNATVIAVAHRLDTVIDHDYILVLGQGKVLEFGPPSELLRNKNGAFFTMVEDTGKTTANELMQRAFR